MLINFWLRLRLNHIHFPYFRSAPLTCHSIQKCFFSILSRSAYNKTLLSLFESYINESIPQMHSCLESSLHRGVRRAIVHGVTKSWTWLSTHPHMGLPVWQSGKELTCQNRRHKRHGFSSWIREDPLEEEVATHSSILAWKIPWTEEPGRIQSRGFTKSQTQLSAHRHTQQILVFDVFSSLFCLGNLAIFLSEAIVRLFHCCIVSVIRIYHNLLIHSAVIYVWVISNVLTFANNVTMNVLITSSVVKLSGHSMIDRY